MKIPFPQPLHILTALCFLIGACMPQPIPNMGKSVSSAGTTLTPKGPYNGLVNLKIDTGLVTGGRGKIVDLTQLRASNDFAAKSVLAGPIVYQETFNKTNKDQLEVTRTFRVTDTTRRYSLIVNKQEPQHGKEGRVQVNINGSWTVREKDFDDGSLAVTREGLLLNASNSLLVRVNGKPGTAVTLSIIDGGDAGTILRRRGWEKDKDLTQADRLRNNDTNYFYPDDPSSLGGLQPFEGDEIQNQGDIASHIGVSFANGTQAHV